MIKELKEIKDGNHDIIAEFYKQYRGEFISWANNRYSIDKDDSKDIFQECLLDFYLSIMEDKLTEVNVTIKTYLFSLCKYKIYNLKKYKDKYVALERVFGITLVDEIRNESDINSAILLSAISKLPHKYQKLLTLYYIEENCLEAISNKLKFKNVNVTKKTKSMCMKLLTKNVREIEFNLKNQCATGS